MPRLYAADSLINTIIYVGRDAQRRAKRCSLGLGEFVSVRDVPHTGVKRIVFYVDCTGTYSRVILSEDNMPVDILHIFKKAPNIFSTRCSA